MDILLDTHTVIWAVIKDSRLPNNCKILLEDSNNRCLVSIASLWEMGIKYSLDRLDLKTELKKIFEIIDETGFNLLHISPQHILINSTLPFHHKDPFDRIIIAQSMTENLIVMTKDKWFDKYDVKVIWN